MVVKLKIMRHIILTIMLLIVSQVIVFMLLMSFVWHVISCQIALRKAPVTNHRGQLPIVGDNGHHHLPIQTLNIRELFSKRK